jgi:hypothetical protein
MTTLSRKQREQAGTAVLYALTAASFALLFVLASCREAPAGTIIDSACSYGRHSAACSTTVLRGGWAKPHVQYVPLPSEGSPADLEREERIRAWENRCVKHIEVDDLGVSRYVYWKIGCEFGR